MVVQFIAFIMQICPGLNAYEIQIPYDKHHKVFSLLKSHLNTHNSVKYEVEWKFSHIKYYNKVTI